MTPTQPPPAIDAVRRSLDLTPENGAVRTVLTLTTPYDPAPAQLWPLLTRPEALAAWYGPVSGDLREGGRFQAPGGAGEPSRRSRPRTASSSAGSTAA